MSEREALREAQRLLADLTGGDSKLSIQHLWARAVEVEVRCRAALAAADRVEGEGWNDEAVWAMTHACGLLDHIKREWEPTNDWTEFDQSVRDKMSELLRQFHEAALPDGWELLPAPPVGRRGKS